jgi:hypothetical protein
MRTIVLATFLATVLLAGCDLANGCETCDGPVPAGVEVAMAPDSSITATTPVGTITIKAGKGLNRCYTWDGATRCIEMYPRTDWWNGCRGLYFPGSGQTWQDNMGISRGVLEECIRHFDAVDEAMMWLKNATYRQWVYRNDGLVVGWAKKPEREQLNVDVFQFVIAEKKPTSLPGANDGAIVVGATPPPETKP